MPKNPPYIPQRQADFATWLLNFATLTTATPLAYGITAPQAADVAAANAAFQSAYTTAVNPSTRTPTSVAAKDNAATSALAIVRPVAQQISKNPAVTAEDKIALGLNANTSTPSPITPPTTYPIVNVQAGGNLALTVRYRDSAASVSVKSKPYGVQSVQLRFGVSASPVSDPAALLGVANLTKSPSQLTFSPGDAGKQCYMAGQYLLANGKTSGFGPMVNFTVPIGG